MGLNSIESLACHGIHCGIAPITPEDFEYADGIYRKMWTRLDHTRTYSLNHRIFAAELLRRSGKYAYPEIKRFTGMKGEMYENTINMMWCRYIAPPE